MNKTTEFNVPATEENLEAAADIKEFADRGLEYLKNKQPEAAILAFKRALEKTAEDLPVSDAVKLNLLAAYRARVSEILAGGDVTLVNPYLPEITALEPKSSLRGNKEFLGHFADTMRNLGLDFDGARQHEVGLYFHRKAISIKPCPSYYVDLANSLAWTKKPAQLRDYTAEYTEADIGNHIFIACAPKSGSTFLKNLLVSVTGFKGIFPVYAALQNEQELDLPNLVKFGNVNTVAQQHCRASEANLQMMQAFGIMPVVLVRNIFDTTISLLDFYTKGYTFSTFFDKDEFLSFDQDTKIDLLIEFVIPWYFQFVASWQRAEKENRIELMWLTYEEMIADKVGTVEKILDFYGMTAPNEHISQKISEIETDNQKNRFNKGVAGRGQSVLTQQQKDKIKNLARFFPSNDFSIIGI